jgi:hypothetical protein
MKVRSAAAPLLLPLVTFGVYGLVWLVKTKNEMNRAGASVPTAWLLLLPIASLIWFWKYAVAVEGVARSGMSRHAAFWLLLLLGQIGSAIVQSSFNSAVQVRVARPQVLAA